MPMSNSKPPLLRNLIPASHSWHSKKLEMASLRCELNHKDDPWRVSAFFSAFMELVLSILLLLGATIAFLTSQLVKYFDLNPPCTYIHGCALKSIADQRPYCCNRHGGDAFCSEGHTPFPYSKLQSDEHSCTDEDDNIDYCHPSNRWNSTSSLRDSDTPNCRHHNQLKQKGVDEAYLPLVSTSSCSDEEDHFGGTIETNDLMNIGNEESFIRAFEITQNERQVYEDIELQRFGNVRVMCRNTEDEDVVSKGIHVMPMEGRSTVHKEKQVDGGSLPKSHGECMASCGPAAPEGVDLVSGLGSSMKEEALDMNLQQDPDGLNAIESYEQGSEMVVGRVGDDDNHSFAPEESLGQELINTELKVFNVMGARNGLDDLQTTSVRRKIESVSVTTCIEKNDICDEDGKVHDEVSAQVDMHENGDVGNACMCTLHSNCAHTTDGPCDRDASSKPSLEMIIQEALDHYLTTFRGSTQEDIHAAAEKSAQQGEDIHGTAEQIVACGDEKDGEEKEVCLERLKEVLQAERETLGALEAELEKERNAAAVATSEAMAMISRLQEEKSALQVEVAQLQRMSEERADYDEQAMALLKEILLKREKEKHALEKEVELYRERFRTEKRKNDGRRSKGLSPQALEPSMMLHRMEEGKVKPWSLSDSFHRAGFTKAHAYGQTGAGNNEGCVQHAEGRETTGPVFSTHEEETEFILKRLWVLEEELAGSMQASSDGNPAGNTDQICVADPVGAECVGDDDDTGPVYDIYEVQSVFPNYGSCQDLEESRVWAHNCKSDGVSCQDEDDGLHSHSRCITVTDGQHMQLGVIQQLAMRLEALESDRELLREIWESLRHRDAERSLLQEIAHHLQALGMVGVRRAFTGQVPFSRTFGKTCATAIKKRKYCKGPGQPHILLIHQTSI